MTIYEKWRSVFHGFNCYRDGTSTRFDRDLHPSLWKRCDQAYREAGGDGERAAVILNKKLGGTQFCLIEPTR